MGGMCGFAGVYKFGNQINLEQAVIREMVAVLSHRGPDGEGFYYNRHVHLGHCRLSIIDLEGGSQPLGNEDGTIQVVFNGEIFNHIELRRQLEDRGHRFSTHSDTEVLVHLYEDHGNDLCRYLNGQFAFAIWDSRSNSVLLARDRIGILPLFYSEFNGNLVFSSEIKGLFRFPGIEKAPDPHGLHEIYTLWATIPPRTVFKNICELQPGSILTASASGIKTATYWQIQFPDMDSFVTRERSELLEELYEHMSRSVRLRLRSDVPVGTYLSGGLDSSVITKIARDLTGESLHSFSIRFADPSYDESSMQQEVSRFLSTRHHSVLIEENTVAHNYEKMIYHGERPVWRSAPGPMMTLSSLVRERGLKVILTGEGSDEIFGGYNIFKENAIRHFWSRDPGSNLRPLLLNSIYTYINQDRRASAFWVNFFGRNLCDTDNPLYSHVLRWENSSGVIRLYNREFFNGIDFSGPQNKVRDNLPDDFKRWHPLCRAQYLEMSIFLPGYLLSSQGERMSMANSIEGRYPFLDHELVEWASKLHPACKLYGLNEKYILKKAYAGSLPPSIIHRPKQPYRAPSPLSVFLFNPDLRKYTGREIVEKQGIFDYDAVSMFIAKLERGRGISQRDDMILNQVLSTAILYNRFMAG